MSRRLSPAEAALRVDRFTPGRIPQPGRLTLLSSSTHALLLAWSMHHGKPYGGLEPHQYGPQLPKIQGCEWAARTWDMFGLMYGARYVPFETVSLTVAEYHEHPFLQAPLVMFAPPNFGDGRHAGMLYDQLVDRPERHGFWNVLGFDPGAIDGHDE